jgi:hypothetical protein
LDRLAHPASFLQVAGNFGGTRITPENAIESAAQILRERRSSILELPSSEQGINVSRVFRYCQTKGLLLKPVKFLEPANYQQALRIADMDPHIENGRYLSSLDMLIINRNADMEELNGTELTESWIVHEEEHADTDIANVEARVLFEPQDGRFRKVMRASVQFTDIATGYLTLNQSGELQGTYLEEGVAELARGKYVVAVLDRPDGFAQRIRANKSRLIDKYTYLVRKPSGVEINFPPGATAAITLERLMQIDPGLADLLKEGHQTADGLAELKKRLNRVRPELYNIMQSIDVDSATGKLEAVNLFQSFKL